MAQVRITLQQPWVGSKDGSIKRRMGFEGAIVPDAADGTSQTYRSNKVIPGAAIWLELRPEEGHNVALLDENWAKLYFGDWTAIDQEDEAGDTFRIVRGPIGNMRVKVPTKSQVKDDVALIWGDYRRETEKGMKQDHPNFPTGGAIGPPAVPHVLIESVGQDGTPDGKLVYDPWDFLGFDADFADFEEGVAGVKVIFDYAKVK
jgi:hypothetical protein